MLATLKNLELPKECILENSGNLKCTREILFLYQMSFFEMQSETHDKGGNLTFPKKKLRPIENMEERCRNGC